MCFVKRFSNQRAKSFIITSKISDQTKKTAHLIDKGENFVYHIGEINLRRRKMKPFADGHIHFYDYNYETSIECLNSLQRLGVTDTAVCSLAAYPTAGPAQNLFALYVKSKYEGPIKLRVFGSLHELDIYKDVDYEKQLDELISMGCEGMKFIHMKPNARKAIGKGLNDPSYDRVLSAMEERGTPMVLHSGDPAVFWDKDKISPAAVARGWFYGDGSYMPYGAYYKEDYAMLDKHPRLNVIFAHFLFLGDNYDEAVRVMETYPNVKFDLTPAWEVYVDFAEKIDKWHDFFEKYSDRILFGTDSSDRRDFAGTERISDLVYGALTHDSGVYYHPSCRDFPIRGLDVSSSTLEKITYGNFAKYVGEHILPVDTDKLYSYAERMLGELTEDDDTRASIKWLRELLGK